jgi:hypothetical protein
MELFVADGTTEAEIAEALARTERNRKWQEEWDSLRERARAGLHVQESDLQVLCTCRRLIKRSYLAHQEGGVSRSVGGGGEGEGEGEGELMWDVLRGRSSTESEKEKQKTLAALEKQHKGRYSVCLLS